MKRRMFMAGGALGVAAVVGIGGWRFWPRPTLAFSETGVPQGYRRLIRAGSGGITAALTGVSLETSSLRFEGVDLCRATFGQAQTAPGRVSIATFTDYFCPYCRVLDEMLRDQFSGDDRVDLIWHQVPLLGRSSRMAARGILAAEQQGAEEALHRRLIRTSFVPNTAYLREFAQANDLDAARLVADLRGAEVEDALAQSLGAFRSFGFAGTPGLVVGRTLVSGVITRAELRVLVAQEAAAPGPCR